MLKFIGGLAVVGILVAAVGSSSSPSADTKAAQKSGHANHAVTGHIGTPVTNAGTTYEVTNVATTPTIGDSQYDQNCDYCAKADGSYVVATLALTNNKNETKTFMDESAKLVTKDGNSYAADTDASIQLDHSLLMEDIQPDLTKRGTIAFDVPPSKLAGAKLVIKDFWGHGQVTIDLGL
jgi:hypothetical protein